MEGRFGGTRPIQKSSLISKAEVTRNSQPQLGKSSGISHLCMSTNSHLIIVNITSSIKSRRIYLQDVQSKKC